MPVNCSLPPFDLTLSEYTECNKWTFGSTFFMSFVIFLILGIVMFFIFVQHAEIEYETNDKPSNKDFKEEGRKVRSLLKKYVVAWLIIGLIIVMYLRYTLDPPVWNDWNTKKEEFEKAGYSSEEVKKKLLDLWNIPRSVYHSSYHSSYPWSYHSSYHSSYHPSHYRHSSSGHSGGSFSRTMSHL